MHELLFRDGTGHVLSDYHGMETPILNPRVNSSPHAVSKEVYH